MTWTSLAPKRQPIDFSISPSLCLSPNKETMPLEKVELSNRKDFTRSSLSNNSREKSAWIIHHPDKSPPQFGKAGGVTVDCDGGVRKKKKEAKQIPKAGKIKLRQRMPSQTTPVGD
jgi:hypothetical protein